jgi:hypothetical protein
MAKKTDIVKSVYSNNEQAFLHHYFDINSPTKGNSVASAVAAGFTENNAYKASARILSKHEKTLLAAALESIGVTKMTLALSLKKIIEDPATPAQHKLAAIKQMATVMGEKVDGGGNVNVSVAAAPKSLVLVGFNDDSVEKMLTGKSSPQLPPSESE